MGVFAAVAAGAVLSAFGVTGASASGAATTRAARVSHGPGTAGVQLWAARYNGPGNRFDAAHAVAVSPSGNTVFVTGFSTGTTSGEDNTTVAYSAATGARLWAARYNGPGNGWDDGQSVAVSPRGGTVFVTGTSTGTASGEDYATVAYNAATGARLWAARYNGPGNGLDSAVAMAVSPGGRTVFVTGDSKGRTSGDDYATVAYSAVTGARLWAARYNGPANRADFAASVAVSPGGGTVFVTGTSTGTASGEDYATVAYSAVTGARLWAARYNGPGNSFDEAQSVAVSPGRGTVFVTGDSKGATSDSDYATVAYSAATGAQLWVRRYNGPGNAWDGAESIAVSPSGRRVFVTGSSTGLRSGEDYATVAYSG